MVAESGRKAKRSGETRERKLGVVDIGSNTVHLLVAQTNGRNIRPLVDESEALRLGGDVDYQGELSEAKLEELIRTLLRFRDMANEADAACLHLLATQAVRTAANHAHGFASLGTVRRRQRRRRGEFGQLQHRDVDRWLYADDTSANRGRGT